MPEPARKRPTTGDAIDGPAVARRGGMAPTPRDHRRPPGPRERLIHHGPAGLEDHDLLALVLGPGGLAVAEGLLARYEDLHGLGRATPAELMRLPGMGVARACALTAALELGVRRVRRMRRRGPALRSARDVHRLVSPRLRHHGREVFVVLFLDGRNRIVREVDVASGGVTACAIHPREVFEPAIREGAPSVLFVHNHPSGDPTPSAEDLALTRRLVRAGEALGIRVLDHVVVGDGTFVSLAEAGLMDAPP